jgi:uncharacterized protein YjbI with pentapeptide repeats
LRGRIFYLFDLTDTDLSLSNLEGAFLTDAYLENADLGEAILPDGSKWTPETDMGRFTDGSHPNFEATLEKIEAIREEYKTAHG